MTAFQPEMRRSEQPQAALGEAIRQLRERRGVTQEDLAHASGITTGTLSLIERGKANPTWATVRRIAVALEVSISEIGKISEQIDAGERASDVQAARRRRS